MCLLEITVSHPVLWSWPVLFNSGERGIGVHMTSTRTITKLVNPVVSVRVLVNLVIICLEIILVTGSTIRLILW